MNGINDMTKGYTYNPISKACVPMKSTTTIFDGKEYWAKLGSETARHKDEKLQELLDKMEDDARKRLYRSLFIGQTRDVRGTSK